MPDFKPGDIVWHKVMPGRFVIISIFSGRGVHPTPDFDVRSPDGKVFAVFKAELVEWNSSVTVS